MTTTKKHKSEEDIEVEKVIRFHFKTIAIAVVIVVSTELILLYFKNKGILT